MLLSKLQTISNTCNLKPSRPKIIQSLFSSRIKSVLARFHLTTKIRIWVFLIQTKGTRAKSQLNKQSELVRKIKTLLLGRDLLEH